MVLLIIAASYYSSCNNKDAFLSFSLSQALTLLVAVGISFNATQYLADERKCKEQIEKIVEKIQLIVSKQEFYRFDPSGDVDRVSAQTMMKNRKLSNCIEVLETYAKDYGLKEEVTYIRAEYRAYDTLVSEKIRDLKYLSESELALRKHSENIDSKCDYIIVRLYKNNSRKRLER